MTKKEASKLLKDAKRSLKKDDKTVSFNGSVLSYDASMAEIIVS